MPFKNLSHVWVGDFWKGSYPNHEAGLDDLGSRSLTLRYHLLHPGFRISPTLSQESKARTPPSGTSFFFFVEFSKILISFSPDYLEVDSDHTPHYWCIQLLIACSEIFLCLYMQSGSMQMDQPEHKWQMLSLLSLPSQQIGFSCKGRFSNLEIKTPPSQNIFSQVQVLLLCCCVSFCLFQLPWSYWFSKEGCSPAVMKQTFCKLLYQAGSQQSVAAFMTGLLFLASTVWKKQFSFLSLKEWWT